MRDDDLERFCIAMTTLAVAMDHDLTEERVEIYWDSLIDYPIAEVEVAVAEAIHTQTKFPKIKDLAALADSAGRARRLKQEKVDKHPTVRGLESLSRDLLPDPAWSDNLAQCFRELDEKYGTSFLSRLKGGQE